MDSPPRSKHWTAILAGSSTRRSVTCAAMQPGPLASRVRSKLSLALKRTELDLRARVHGVPFAIDYGWCRLPYSGDGDVQEIAYHLNQARWYEKDIHVFRSLIAPGQTAIDVGANSGFITLMLASLVGPQGRVLSFEPSPAVFAKLQNTIAVNGLSQVVAKNLGCGSTTSTARLSRVSNSTGNSSIVAAGTHPIYVQIEPLDNIPEAWESPVALLKIDTEGYEPEVLRGAERLIAEHRPVIYLEMGGDYVESTLESIGYLARSGYDVEHVRSIDWTQVGNGSDYFFLPTRSG
jgi:FkbM family methyltransferase